MVKTYDPKKVLIACGTHSVTGLADDAFVSVEPAGEGVTKKVGCDGEIVRSISPDKTSTVKITLLQTSDSNSFLQQMYNQDQQNGDGIFPLMIQDLMGGVLFSAEEAWVAEQSTFARGKADTNREWEIHTGQGTMEE